MNLKSALGTQEIPLEIRENIALLELEYSGFDRQLQIGQLIIHRDLQNEVRAIFEEILTAQFPIEKMRPVSFYNFSDDASMADNNSSAFNYRRAVGKSQLSQHAFGRAIDINPMQNPYIKGELILPPNGIYNPGARGTLLADSAVVVAFEKRGWTWGGRWTSLKDWHHFEKPTS